MAIDVGDIEQLAPDAARGPPVVRSARLAGMAHRGQILLSGEAVEELTSAPGDWVMRGLGAPEIPGVDDVTVVHQLDVEGMPTAFPPLRADGLAVPFPDQAPRTPGYEVRDVVGTNSLGVVHRGYQPSVGREVAITVVRSDAVDEADFIRRFEADAHVLARLDHANIVPLHDYWREPGAAYFVTRWVHGPSLAELRDTAALSRAEVSGLVRDVGAALGHAQQRGVVAGQLHPGDVLRDGDGRHHVVPFGFIPTVPGGRRRRAAGGGPAHALMALVQQVADDLPDAAMDLMERTAGSDDPDLAEFIAAFVAHAEGGGATDGSSTTPGRQDVRNPYKGLASFDEVDAADFVGRDDLIDEVIATLAERPLVAVVGPSGIGKSSLVRAGVVPRLRGGAIHGSGSWLITELVPGADPIGALASALRRLAVRPAEGIDRMLRSEPSALAVAVEQHLPAKVPVLLVIDQLEELFTLTRDPDDRVRFLDLLVAALRESPGRIRVILTVRADHFDRPLRHPAFGALLRGATVAAHGPTDDQLREIIRQPAASVGVVVEDALVERIVAEVGAQPGALPLVEFALTELFEQRATDVIAVAAHEGLGGIAGTLASRAESVVASLPESDRDRIRGLFLQLVAVDEESVGGRRVQLVDLVGKDIGRSSLQRVIDAFGEARLLTFDRDRTTRTPTVELAHEALITGWPRLSEWIDEARHDLVRHRRLAAATREWLTNGRAEGFLLGGPRLAQHEAWTATTTLQLSPAERSLLGESHTRERALDRRRRRRRRTILGVLAGAAVVASLLAGLAWNARNTAARDRDIAQARRLLASAGEVAATDPELSLLLAVEAAERLPDDPEAMAALHAAAAANRTLLAVTWPDEGAFSTQVDMTDDGGVIALSGQPGGVVEVRTTDTGEVRWQHDFSDGDGGDLLVRPRFVAGDREVLVLVQFSPQDNARADSPPDAVGAHVFDAATGELLRSLPTSDCGAWMAAGGVGWAAVVSEDGDRYVLWNEYPRSRVAANGCLQLGSAPTTVDVVRVDIETGDRVLLAQDMEVTRGNYFTALSRDGSVGAIDPLDGPRTVVHVATGRVLLELPDADTEGPVALSADGSLVAFSSTDASHRTSIHDVATGERISTTAGHAEGAIIFTARFSADGRRIYTTSGDGTARLWDVRTGVEVDRVGGLNAPAVEPRLSADGDRLALSTFGREVRVVDLTPGGQPEVAPIRSCGPGRPSAPTVSAGRLLLRQGVLLTHVDCDGPDTPGQVFAMDVASGAKLAEVPAMGVGVALSADGRLVAAQEWAVDDGEIHAGRIAVRDVVTGDVVVRLEGLCSWVWTPSSTVDDGAGQRTGAAGPPCGAPPAPPLPAVSEGVAFSPDAELVAVAVGLGDDALVLVSDVSTGRLRGAVPGDGAAFVGPDQLFVYEHVSGRVAVHDVDGLGVVAETQLPDLPLFEDVHVVTATEEVVARLSALGDARIVRIDLTDLTVSSELQETHEGQVLDIDVNLQAGLIASVGADGRARVWDLSTNQLVHDLALPDDAVAVAVSDDGRRLYTTAATGPVRGWILDGDELLAHARSRVTRGFSAAECARYLAATPCPDQP